MGTLKRMLTIGALAVFLLSASIAYAESEYIKALDITVIEQEEGNVAILQIGRYSPFRRYSWFRAGDVIESVNGVKTTVYVLNSLQKDQDPHVKYRRGDNVSAERQISLEISIYGLPPYLNAK